MPRTQGAPEPIPYRFKPDDGPTEPRSRLNPPQCVSWIEAAAPSTCTASTRRRRPGSAARSTTTWSGIVRPSGVTAP